jgi:hypothetical protein
MNASFSLLLILAAAVLALLVGAIGLTRARGRAMTHEEFERLSARTQVLGRPISSHARFHGKASGVVLPDNEWSFRELKEAWRSGGWWSDPEIRSKWMITAGGTLVALGGFALMAVLVRPPAAKILLGGACVYALVRLIWSFVRA